MLKACQEHFHTQQNSIIQNYPTVLSQNYTSQNERYKSTL